MTTRRAVLLLLAACALLQVLPAGVGALYNETDGQYAGAARAMVQGGSWIIPENNGLPRLVKPPLLYWLMAVSFQTFGINEFAARLPGALGVTAWVLATFAIAAHAGGPTRGLWAGIILLTSLGTATLGRIIMPEPIFGALVAWAIYAGMRAVSAPRPPANGPKPGRFLPVLFWVCAALACFAKGLHGLLYPLGTIVLAAACVPGWRRGLPRLASPLGVAAFLAINLPWYFAVEARFPGWFHNFVFAEQAGHVTGSADPATHYENVPVLQFLALHLAWFFPWSIVALVLGSTGLLRAGFQGGLPDALRRPWQPGTILLLAWTAVVVIPLLFLGQRQDYYAMAAWPVFALAVAPLVEHRSLRPAVATLLALTAVGLATCAGLLAWAPPAGESLGVAARATAWSTVTGFGPEVWRGLTRLGLGVLSLGLALLVAGLLVPRLTRALLAATAALFCLGAVLGYALVSPYFSLAGAAAALRKLPPDAPIVFEGDIDTASSLLFYASQPVQLIGPDPDREFITRHFGIGRQRYLSPEKFAAAWASGRPLAFVVERSAVARWESILGPLPPPRVICGTQLVIVREP